MAEKGTSHSGSIDHSGTVVTAAMVLLALLGVATVFHEPIGALFAPPPAATEPGAPAHAPP
jgi:uncharacterized iron-regulated membrane protein